MPTTLRALFVVVAIVVVAFGIVPYAWQLLQSSVTGSTSAGNANDRRPEEPTPAARAYGPPLLRGRTLSPFVVESSGLAASRTSERVLWTHNDSGGGPYLYCINLDGRPFGVWRVVGAEAVDWEDMAAGRGPEQGRSYLYIGDIGDNESRRDEITVYRIPEPAVTGRARSPTERAPMETAPAVPLTLRYPDGAHDAESLLVHPKTGDIYIVTKVFFGPAAVYRTTAPGRDAGVVKLERVASISAPGGTGFFTAGDIAPGGRRLVLCDGLGGLELELPGDERFDSIWRQPPHEVALGPAVQREAVAYSRSGNSLFTTSEGRRPPLYELQEK